MTTRYIYHGGDGSSGTVFAAGMAGAYASIDLAIAAAAAGDEFLFAHDHDDQVTLVATKTLTIPGTISNPSRIGCINRTTGADQSANAAARAKLRYSGSFGVNVAGFFSWEGVDIWWGIGSTGAINCGIGTAVTQFQSWRRCKVYAPVAGSLNSRLLIGTNGCSIRIDESFTYVPGNTNGYVGFNGHVEWRNSPVMEAGTIPSSFMYASLSQGAMPSFIGCDFTALSGKTIVPAISVGVCALIRFIDCVFPNNVTLAASQVATPGVVIEFINCSKADGTIIHERHTHLGISSLDQTVYRTGGGSDGTTSFGTKLVSNANCNRYSPMRSFDLQFRVGAGDVGVAKTVTAFLASNNVTYGANEAWAEVDYLGDATSLDTTKVSSGPDNITTNGTAPSADAVSTWTGVPGTPVKQSVSVGFTPLREGEHLMRVFLGKVSSTVWVDPEPVLT
jgi:hypothetical protein